MIWELHLYLYIDEEHEVVSGVNISLVRDVEMCVYVVVNLPGNNVFVIEMNC